MPKIVSEIPCYLECNTRNGGTEKKYMVAVGGGGKSGGALNSFSTDIGEMEQFTLLFQDTPDGYMVSKIQTCNEKFLRVKVYAHYNPEKPVNTQSFTAFYPVCAPVCR